MSQPTPPILDRSARLEGHRRSLELRRRRAGMKAWLRQDAANFTKAWQSEAAQGMKVRDLLLALPYIGPVKARALLAAAGIPDQNTVRACGPKQTERLFALLNK